MVRAIDPGSVYLAIAIASASLVAWSLLLVRVTRALHRRTESRRTVLTMAIVGLLASVGTLASAVGFGVSSGTLTFPLDQATLTLVASMGRGALLMGGVLIMTCYRPRDDRKEHP